MMFTCSALRCSVLEGSAISGTSGDSGADDPTAPQGIPDAVLYVTVDDQALADVLRDLEHATDLALDTAGDIRARRRREFDSAEVCGPHGLEQVGIGTPLRIRSEQA